MAIPLIPLLAGVAIGSLATYLYNDEKTRKQLKKAASGATDKAKQTSDTVSRKVSAGVSSLKEKVSRSTTETKVAPEEDAVAIKAQTVKKKTRKVVRKKVATKKSAAVKAKPSKSTTET